VEGLKCLQLKLKYYTIECSIFCTYEEFVTTIKLSVINLRKNSKLVYTDISAFKLMLGFFTQKVLFCLDAK